MKHCLFSIYSPQQIRQQETLIFWLDNDVSRTTKRPIKYIYILFFLSRPLELPGGGWGWRGRILEPAVGDDEKAGKPSSWHNLLQFFWQSLKCAGKLATSSPTKVVNNFLLREMDRKTSSFSMTLLFIICQSNFSFYDWPILIFCPHWLIK